MAEELMQAQEDEQYKEWLALADEDDAEDDSVAEAAETEAEREDAKALKMAQQTHSKLDEFITEQKVKEVEETFRGHASEEEQRLVDIWRKGDESPEQLKKLMQLAHTKVSETIPEEVVEKRVNEKLQDEYGVGPLSAGGGSHEKRPEEVFDELREKARAGDSHAAFQLFNGLPGNGEISSPD